MEVSASTSARQDEPATGVSSSSGSPLQALTERQESRLVLFLDQQLLLLSQAFESRSSPNSAHRTLASYLGAVLNLPVHAYTQLTTLLTNMILTIPPIEPSHSLRVAYALTLTGLLAPAIKAYPVPEASLPILWATVKTFDQAWIRILLLRPSGPSHPDQVPFDLEEISIASSSTGTSWTVRARLSSLIGEIRRSTAMALGIASFESERRKAYNPRGEVVQPRIWDGEERNALEQVGLGDLDDGYREESSPGSQAVKMEGNGSLGRGTMEGESIKMEEDGDDDGDDEDDEDGFEEVDVMEEEAQDDVPASVEVHFKPPPARLPIATFPPHSTELKKGFDPDLEYPDSDDDARRGEDEDRTAEEETNAIFEKTLQVLSAMAQQG
ncbi:BZ3500_MvSof-1268-A1-R1_Chr8-1g09776 [Microbotryum saponariae]|uniref:BZ3500_MvSof-1268-A1-R1_Chr8-1g09776 protein n=1 Tax=Microbotryum saponariae TaxID=289078 RepID=A0A2X0MUJ3_9BASI|nr:BZ3500_MvSof-1268-A1-R1_Chr8-1g09776 [Microbotryum saponariae]SDA08062.1 BZ3501_MvSof-1269-A2-R1_Chr8-1g09499 [Microbotryum saponariae]